MERASLHDRLRSGLSGRYTIECEVGRGGMASVWLAQDLRHGRPVAIKVLHPELAGALGVDRFLREIRLTAKLQHPNIIPILDSGALDAGSGPALPWYTMPYVEGEALRARLDREGALPVDEAIHITEEVAKALTAAHREGVVHRDIKPGNLLLSDRHVYVADFGVAKALSEAGGEGLTNTGVAIGTLAYMSPEQSTAGTVGPRSDQYALACVLYEMLVGDPPFTARNPAAVVARRLAEPAPKVRSARSSVPAPVEAAVLRGLERVPADRFPDVGAFAAALRASEAPPSPFARMRVRQPASAAVALALLIAAVWGIASARGRTAAERSPELVALYERGVRAYDERTPTGIIESVSVLNDVVGRDSTYVEAWAALALAYSRAYERGFPLPGLNGRDVLRRANDAADRAVLIDENNAEAWRSVAYVERLIDPTNVGQSLRAARRSIALDSTNAPAWHVLAMSQAESLDVTSARDSWQRSVMVDPRYTQGLAFAGFANYWKRQYDDALRWADSAVAVDSRFVLGREAVGQIRLELGDFEGADASLAAAERLVDGVEYVNVRALRGAVAARRGDRAGALRFLQSAEDLLAASDSPTPLHTAAWIAAGYAELGDVGRAVEWASRYDTPRDLHFQLHLRCDPNFTPIEDHAEFKALLVKSRPPAPAGC